MIFATYDYVYFPAPAIVFNSANTFFAYAVVPSSALLGFRFELLLLAVLCLSARPQVQQNKYCKSIGRRSTFIQRHCIIQRSSDNDALERARTSMERVRSFGHTRRLLKAAASLALSLQRRMPFRPPPLLSARLTVAVAAAAQICVSARL